MNTPEFDFDAAIDTIEIDPRRRLKAIVKNLVDSELGRQGLSSDQISRFASSARRELAASAKACIESGDYTALDKHLTEFRMSLRRVLQFERERGELRAVTPASEIERNREALRAHLYGAAPEASAIEALLTDGERLVKIGWNTIETDRQEIRRVDLPKVLRPTTFRDGPAWRSQFISDARVQEAIEEERRAATIQHQHGQPSRWIE